MITASVVSPMIGNGTIGDVYRARLQDIPGASVIEDATEETPPPVPNACVFECVFTQAAFDAVLADPEYLVLWSVDNG